MTFIRDPEENETRAVLDFIDVGGAHVLEIGCGDGRLTWRYAADTGRITAVDLDPARLAQAVDARPAKWADKVSFVKASGLDLPFRAEIFDRAILAWSL